MSSYRVDIVVMLNRGLRRLTVRVLPFDFDSQRKRTDVFVGQPR